MNQEQQDQLKDLADALYTMRADLLHGSPGEHFSGDGSYVFFIGGGASTIGQQPFIDELQRETLQRLGARPTYAVADVLRMSPSERMEHFGRKWLGATFNPLKSTTLRNLLGKLKLTDGHRILAELLRDRYLSLVLTTTIDQLIETAFVGSLTRTEQPPQWWSVLDNKGDPPADDLREIMQLGPTIVKLCGSLPAPAVTKSQVEQKARQACERWRMEEILQRNLVIIAPTSLDDLMFQQFPDIGSGGTVYFISSNPPSVDLQALLKPRDPVYVRDDELDFDLALQTISAQIETLSKLERYTGKPVDEGGRGEVRELQQTASDKAEVIQGYMSRSESARRQTGNTGDLAPVQTPPAETPTHAEQAPHREESDDELIEIIEDDGVMEDDVIVWPEAVVCTVKMEPDHRVSYTVAGGKFNTSGSGARATTINVSDVYEFMSDMRRKIVFYLKMSNRREQERNLDFWRKDVRRNGKKLYNDLVQAYPDLREALGDVRQTALKDGPANVTLAFESSRADLGMPFELLFDGETPLALGNPLCRRISDAPARLTQHFDDFLVTLSRQKQPLKVLLIATGLQDTSADQEIAELETLIREEAARRNLRAPDIKAIPSARATYDTVQKELAQCPYHLVHCAGQGTFDDDAGVNCALLLRRNERSKEPVILTTTELAGLLETGETRLFYLGNCVGAWTDSDLKLYNNDYLGAMDAITRAGIPYVLGFRWHVAEEQSRLFALSFYRHLCQPPFVPERAAWYARRQIQETYRGIDEAWTSPILIAQNLYMHEKAT